MGFAKSFMKDLRSLTSLYPVAKWIMRIFVFVYVLVYYGPRFLEPSLTSEYFFLAIVYVFSAFLLLIGGFGQNSNLTRIAAFILFFAIISHLIAALIVFHKFDELFASRLLFLSIVIYFLTSSKRFERPKKSSSADGLFDERETKDIEA